MSRIGLFTDFGSTYTKIVAIDLDNEIIVGQSQSASTVDRDICIGFRSALETLESRHPALVDEKYSIKLACSSAAGGLGLVVIGLVPSLTMKAAKMAALGAGAKVKAAFSYKLNRQEVSEIDRQAPDIILLAGGTDGGNEEVIVHNARMLGESETQAPIIVAGNKACADDIKHILESKNRPVTIVGNVLSDLDKLNVEPSRAAIRQIFMDRIVFAKGLDKAMALVDKVVMPTPMAVLKSAELIASGAGSECGLGELLLIDIGGATTDVHSIAHGHSRDQSVVEKGLPEPFAKRTVEGDLGLRCNAVSILEEVGIERLGCGSQIADSPHILEKKIRELCTHTSSVPESEQDYLIDIALACAAIETAVKRHVGYLEPVYTTAGTVMIQMGKDLTGVQHVVGTGGVFAHGKNASGILEGAVFKKDEPLVLRPKSPRLHIDKKYILFAIGLLADVEPEKAVRIGKKYLEELTV